MDDKKIISGIKKRKEPYLNEFINKYGGILKASIVKTIGKRDELVIEILNDTLLAIWDNIDSFDESRSSFKNWCAGVAKYKAIDAIRKENRHKSIELSQVENNVCIEEDFSIDESQEILKLLSDEDREIFRKLFVEGYSYDDLSKITEIPKDRLYNKVSRSKKKLRLQLGGKYD